MVTHATTTTVRDLEAKWSAHLSCVVAIAAERTG